jgi:hypothetical protein
MKRTLLTLVILAMLIMPVSAAEISKNFIFRSVIANTTITLLYTGTYSHRIAWTGSGTRTTCSIRLSQSVDGITWTDLIAATSCTTDGTATTTGYANYVRLETTAFSGTGNTLYVNYYGTLPTAALGAVTVSSSALPTGAATSALQGGGLPAALGTGGGLKVDGSGTALPVSGTFYQTIQPTSPWANGTFISGAVTTAMVATTSTSVIAGVGSNYLYITHCSFSNDHASVSTLMNLQDGTGGTVLWGGFVPFGGGREVHFPSPLKVPTVGNGLFVVNVTTGSSTYCSCNGFRSTVSY